MRRSLTRQERVRKRSDLKRLFSRARKAECAGLKLLYLPNDLPINRVALAPVRGFRGAVRRNRARRVCREAYRSLKEQLRTGYDLIFIIRPGGYSLADRAAQILTLAEQARIRR